MFLRNTPDRTAMHNEDFCSVAIVSHNRHHRLNRLIDSIHEHADMPFELVVCEDGGRMFENFDFLNDMRHKVGRVELNMGWNMGLHVNSNNAVAMTRGRNVFLLYDDVEILGPFMRKHVQILESAPYMGIMYLGDKLPDVHIGTEELSPPGILNCRSSQGHTYITHCSLGSSWASAFRREVWEEVGGYSEDSIYGDIPFINKMWLRGYFSGQCTGPQIARDTDKDGPGGCTQDSSLLPEKGVTNGICNYPKLFGMPSSTLASIGMDRNSQCASRNDRLRYKNEDGSPAKFTEWTWGDWHEEYMGAAWNGQEMNWEVLNRFHSRYLNELKRDLRTEKHNC